MAIEVIQNPIWIIVQLIVFLVCSTALFFITLLLMCGVHAEDFEEA